MEWNISEANRPGSSIEKVSDFIRSQNLDIACLQEVKKDLFVDQAKELANRTGLANYFHGGWARGLGCTILSRFKFYPITHHIPEVVSGDDGPRVIVEARTSVPGVNRLRIYNTHWTHRIGKHRVEAAKLTASLVKKVVTEPIIYAGDLNNQPPGYRPIEPGRERDAEAYNYLIDAGLIDSVNVAPPGSIQCGWMPEPEPHDKKQRIDYIFFGGQFQVQSYNGRCYDPGEPAYGLSDHTPIIAQLLYSGPPDITFWPRGRDSWPNGRHLDVARNLDGRLEVFRIDKTSNNIYHNWQRWAGGAWYGWERLGNPDDRGTALALGQNYDGRLEVFLIGTSSDIWHNWQRLAGGTWYGWQQLGDDYGRDLVVGQNYDGRLEVFYNKAGDEVHHNWQITPGGAWYNVRRRIGTYIQSRKTFCVARNLSGWLEVFGIVGDTNNIYHNWQKVAGTIPWQSNWQRLGTAEQRFIDLVVGQNYKGTLEVFGIAPDNSVWHTWQLLPGGEWYRWERLGTAENKAISIAVGQNYKGTLEVFGIAPDNSVWHTWQLLPGGEWYRWERLGTAEQRFIDLVVGQNHDGRLEVFGIAPDNSVWHTWQLLPSGEWYGWNRDGLQF